jgi:hypothetical protein
MPTTTFKNKSSISQISSDEILFEINDKSINIDDSIKNIMDKIEAVDVNYSKQQIGDTVYVSIYKNTI